VYENSATNDPHRLRAIFFISKFKMKKRVTENAPPIIKSEIIFSMKRVPMYINDNNIMAEKIMIKELMCRFRHSEAFFSKITTKKPKSQITP
jgi:hypothetical protein